MAAEIREKGRDAHSYVVDCSKKEEVYRAAKQVREEVGDVAVLVNNAGIVTGRKFLETKDESIERTFAVNTLAHFWVRAPGAVWERGEPGAVWERGEPGAVWERGEYACSVGERGVCMQC